MAASDPSFDQGLCSPILIQLHWVRNGELKSPNRKKSTGSTQTLLRAIDFDSCQAQA